MGISFLFFFWPSRSLPPPAHARTAPAINTLDTVGVLRRSCLSSSSLSSLCTKHLECRIVRAGADNFANGELSVCTRCSCSPPTLSFGTCGYHLRRIRFWRRLSSNGTLRCYWAACPYLPHTVSLIPSLKSSAHAALPSSTLSLSSAVRQFPSPPARSPALLGPRRVSYRAYTHTCYVTSPADLRVMCRATSFKFMPGLD